MRIDIAVDRNHDFDSVAKRIRNAFGFPGYIATEYPGIKIIQLEYPNDINPESMRTGLLSIEGVLQAIDLDSRQATLPEEEILLNEDDLPFSSHLADPGCCEHCGSKLEYFDGGNGVACPQGCLEP